MIRRISLGLVAFAALIGLAWAQPALYLRPTLQFDDSAFSYRMSEGYLHFRRDIDQNTLLIWLDADPEPGGIAVAFDNAHLLPTDSWFPQLALRNLLGIELTETSILLPIYGAEIDTVELLTAFTDMLPSIGFVSDMQMVAGNTYTFRCGCTKIADTTLQLSFTPVEDTIFVQLTLHNTQVF